MKSSADRLSSRRPGGQDPDHASIPEDEGYWREYLGEYLDAAEVQQLLSIEEPETIDDLVAANKLLAIPTSRGMACPKFQFVGGAIHPTMARVVEIFSSVVATPYTIASWLRGARFEDKSVAEWVESGEDPEVIIQAAADSAARLSV